MQENASTTYMAGQPEEGFEPYRSISKAAVLSLIFGTLSAIGFLFPVLLSFAVIGLFFGILGHRNTRRFPNEITGRIPAILGTVLCLVVLVGGITTHSVIYATEVPDGYSRVSFSELKSENDGPDIPPADATELDGERVFIKGYVYPDGQKSGIKQFVLVPDLGTCCFGGQPKLTHMIQVTLRGSLSIDYTMQKRKLAGVLTVDNDLKPVSGLGGVYYQLAADIVK